MRPDHAPNARQHESNALMEVPLLLDVSWILWFFLTATFMKEPRLQTGLKDDRCWHNHSLKKKQMRTILHEMKTNTVRTLDPMEFLRYRGRKLLNKGA